MPFLSRRVCETSNLIFKLRQCFKGSAPEGETSLTVSWKKEPAAGTALGRFYNKPRVLGVDLQALLPASPLCRRIRLVDYGCP